jgi:4-azaleucine resistance transporter AzlC
MIFGILALGAGLPMSAAQAMSAIIFAGSSQFVAAQLFALSAQGLVIVATVGIINLRHLLYSASVAPYLNGLPSGWKYLLAYLLTDEAYAVTITRLKEGSSSPHQHWYFLGAGLTLWLTWQLSTAAGIFLGAAVPSGWSLDFTLALTFIALVVPALKDRASLGAAITAGILAVILFSLPYKLGMFLASVGGILVGLWLEGSS